MITSVGKIWSDRPGSASRSWRGSRLFAVAVLVLAAAPGTAEAQAQTGLPPDKGGTIYSLGMPPVYKGNAAVTLGPYDTGPQGKLNALLGLGLHRSLGSPVVGLAALGLEGYAGLRGTEFDGGGRALLMVPALYLTVGADFNVPDNQLDLLWRLELPLRRGGILGRGTMLRFDWVPTRGNTLGIGINTPLWGRNIGATRPKAAAVKIESPPLREISLDDRPRGLDESLARLSEAASWIARMAMPFADMGGAEPAKAYAASMDELKARIAERGSFNEQILAYQDELDHAFTSAAAGRALPEGEISEQGRAVSAAARRIFLDEVIFPYNRLLGQRKTNDSLDQFEAVGHAEFARWILSESDLPEERFRATFFVFQTMVDIAEEVRRQQRERWEDSRFVWLPLQLGLRPDEHDSQAELDAVIERAVGQRFTRGNRVWYVMNEEFQLEMARSVHRAEDYHVLWIHDYRGKIGGKPDRLAFDHTVRSYLSALTQRVREYDETGRLPAYFIFLDQHYFEINEGRYFLRVLTEPLDNELDLPAGYEAWEEELRAVQDSLRQAVAESRLLQVQASQYGEKWLKKLIKVHVNITNPSDFSFSSFQVAGIIPIPDNIMRDHRKIAFYDITEDDPYKGLAMYTGMGIGEHYAGANWEDRAIMVQGPAALSVKDAARHLLEIQGFTREEMPMPLRARPKPAEYDARVEEVRQAILDEWSVDPGGVLELHNETGYTAKEINIIKAVLYSLMPAGSLLKIPDSLWQSYVYASLLAGSALRGCKVLVYAPSLASAPSSAGPTMARAHGLFSALVYLRSQLAAQFAAAGGVLGVGLYAPRSGVGDLRGRVTQAREVREKAPWLGELYPGNPATQAVLHSLETILDEAGYEKEYLVESDSTQSPKLHLKANFFISGEAWERLYALPEWGPLIREYLLYLARQAGPADERLDVREVPATLTAAAKNLIGAMVASTSEQERERWIAYLTVGSANMDYRSMVMDGEVMVTVSGWNSITGLIDFLLLIGLSEWIDDQEQLDGLLPPPGGTTRKIANLMKLAL